MLLLSLALAGCEPGSESPLEPASEELGSLLSPSFAHGSQPRDSELNQGLAQLRRATARFHNVDVAVNEGWGVQLTLCLTNPPLGAQGFHYGNVSIIDGVVNLTKPELLMYEPRRNGLRLVGVEYIVPFAFVPADATPPSLLGRNFHAEMDIGLWALHVWVWRHNPSGMFADWNPKVSC